jgi:hypothetical protein
MTVIPLIAVLSASISAGSPPLPLRSADEVVARMIARDGERQAALHGYKAARRYVLENGSRHKRAEMLVRMTCREDGSKEFEVVSESGWEGAREICFSAAPRGGNRRRAPGLSRAVPYRSRQLQVRNGGHGVRSRPPGLHDRNRTQDREQIPHARENLGGCRGIRHCTGRRQARQKSLVLDKERAFRSRLRQDGAFWFPVSDRSVTDVRIFGSTQMTIEYFDYMPNDSAVPTK